MERCCHLTHYVFGACHLHISYVFVGLFWHLLAEHSLCAELHRLRYELVSVYLSALHCHEQMSVLDTARVDVDTRHFYIIAAFNSKNGDVLKQFFKFHISLFFYPSLSEHTMPFFILSPAPMLCSVTFPLPVSLTFTPLLSIRKTASRAPMP